MNTATLLQLIIAAFWAATLLRNTRRLFRLARPGWPVASRSEAIRNQAQRLWWWLGRHEFWELVQVDAAHCVQLTLMVFVLALNV